MSPLAAVVVLALCAGNSPAPPPPPAPGVTPIQRMAYGHVEQHWQQHAGDGEHE